METKEKDTSPSAPLPALMTAMLRRRWLAQALAATALWGVWGALIELPEKAGFPATLGYVSWAAVMIPCAAFMLRRGGRGGAGERGALAGGASPVAAIVLGSAAGLTGAGGQLALFEALRSGPAYLVFPLISLYPVVTVLLSVALLGERARGRHKLGIALALPAALLLAYAPPAGAAAPARAWLLPALIPFFGWGVQGYLLKRASAVMSSERVFLYLTATGLALAPLALLMTDFARPVNWGPSGAVAAAGIHLLNALGAVAFVYALREGPAILIVPLTSLAPLVTVALSLLLYGRLPLAPHAAGMALAALAMWLLST
jgi:drug/metabolite transporter (DMT)-like permease